MDAISLLKWREMIPTYGPKVNSIVHDRQFFSWHKSKRISMAHLPAKQIKITCTRGVYLNPANISVEGLDPKELSSDLREVLFSNPVEIIY